MKRNGDLAGLRRVRIMAVRTRLHLNTQPSSKMIRSSSFGFFGISIPLLIQIYYTI